MLPLQSIINELKKVPPEEYYRFIVDGDKHKSESGWLKYALREPGSLPAAFRSFQFALTNLDDLTITPDLIAEIHLFATSGVENLNTTMSDYRKWPVYFNLTKSDNNHWVDKEGFETLYDWIKQNKETEDASLIDRSQNDKLTKEEMWEKIENGGSFVYNPPTQYVRHLIQKTCDDYNRLIKETDDPDKKLGIIAEHVQLIERIHPFEDGNCRTSLILLQRLLMQNGFLPVMLADPNDFDGFGPNSLVNEIKKGIDNTKEIISGKKEIFDYKTQKIELQKEGRSYSFIIEERVRTYNKVIVDFYQAQGQMEQFINEQMEITNSQFISEQMEIINNRLVASRLKELVKRFGEKKEIATILNYLSSEGYQCYYESLNEPWELLINWASQKEENFSFLKQSMRDLTKNQLRNNREKIPLTVILLDSLNQKGLKNEMEEILSSKSNWLNNSTLLYYIAVIYPPTERFTFIKEHINLLQNSDLVRLSELLSILPEEREQNEILRDVGMEYIKSLIKNVGELLLITGTLLPASKTLLINELAKDENFIKNIFDASQISFILDYLPEEQQRSYLQYYSAQTSVKQTKPSSPYVVLPEVDVALAKDEASRKQWQSHYDKFWLDEDTDSWLANTKSMLQDYLSLYQGKTNDVLLAHQLLDELEKINLVQDDDKATHFETLMRVEKLIESYQDEAKKLSIESKEVVVDKLSSRIDYISNKLTSIGDNLSDELFNIKPSGL